MYCLWQQNWGNRMEPLFILWTELNGICVDLSSRIQRDAEFHKIPDSGRYYHKTHSFQSNVSLQFMLKFSSREVSVTQLHRKPEAQHNALCTLYAVPFGINSIATERSLSQLLH